jgi:hypothetical protein
MGEITYQGDSPFRLIPAQPTTARAVGDAIELIVFGSVDGAHPADFPIQIPMSSADARELLDHTKSSRHRRGRERSCVE